MKRRVIQLAQKTLVVSLPSKWVKGCGIAKGDELEAEERGRHIIFSTAKKTGHERVQIDATRMDNQALKRWMLPALHKTGFDEIEIFYREQSTLKAIQETTKDVLTGFAVIEQSRNRCVLRVVAEEQEKEFDAMLRRAFLVTKGLGESIYSYLKEGKLGLLNELTELERTNNQLTNFCERILNKKGYRDDRKRCFAYVIVWNLEKICDHYKDICTYLSENRKAKIRAGVAELVREANSFFGGYYELFYKFESGMLSELAREREKFRKKALELMKGASVAESVVLCNMDGLVTKTADFSASMVALNC